MLPGCGVEKLSRPFPLRCTSLLILRSCSPERRAVDFVPGHGQEIRPQKIPDGIIRRLIFLAIFHRLVLVMGKIVVIKRIQGHVRSFQSGKTGKCIRRFGVQAERKTRSVYGRHGKTRNRERKIFFIGSRLYMALSSPAARPEGTCSPKPHIFSKRNPPHIRTPCPPVSVQTCFSPCVFSVQKRDSF